MLATGAALALACGAIFAYDWATYPDAMLRALTPQADIVGSNAASAIVFGDPDAATETLSALRAEPHVVSAGVLRPDGRVFATYRRADVTDAAVIPPLLPDRPDAASHYFAGDHLVVVRPVDADGERVGAVFIQSDLEAIRTRFARYGAIVVAVALASFAVALVLASRAQRGISEPVLRLAAAAQAVSDARDYSVRVAPSGAGPRDELALLVDTFNEMLTQIQARDRELEAARHELEARVAERTRDLLAEVAERRRLEEQLRRQNERLAAQNRTVQEASRLKSEFLANMSHELRTPLNAILGFSEVMVDGIAGPVTDDQREYLGHVLASGRHLLQLINDVLDLSKVEAGQMELHPELLDPGALAHEVADILRSLSARRRIDVAVEVEPALGQVLLDPGKLKQVLYNFLSNAIKFTPEGGRVTIRIRAEDGERFRVEVEDTGIGIRPEDFARLFVEFQQLDAGTAKQYPGTGLGLALTKRIVEAQGGRVGVDTTYGRGSTFHAVLPRDSARQRALAAADHSPETAVGAEAGAPEADAPGPRILVVEDDVADREWLRRTLSEAGYLVDAVARGTDAIARARERRYDAITLDVLLPDLSGREVLAGIRADGKSRDAPMIVVTVVSEEEAGTGFAVHDFLVKPARADDLLGSLRAAGVQPSQVRPVLVVDDDPRALKLMEITLAELGYRSVCASDGAAGLEAARAELPAAVIVDLMMPGMDGFEFIERFRGCPGGRVTPALVWTVKELDKDERARVRRTAQGMIQKGGAGAASLLDELRAHLAAASSAGARVGSRAGSRDRDDAMVVGAAAAAEEGARGG